MITTKNSMYVLPAARKIYVRSKGEATRTKDKFLLTTVILKFKCSKLWDINQRATNDRSANQLEKVLPVVLGHKSEEGKEGPAKRVEAGVAKVRIPPSLHACVSFWALSINREGESANNTGCHRLWYNTVIKGLFLKILKERDKTSIEVFLLRIHTQHQSCFHKAEHHYCHPNSSDSLQPNKKTNMEVFYTVDNVSLK